VIARPNSPARFVRRSIYATLTGISLTCLLGTLLTDVVYSKTAAMQWANISAWLLTVGLIVAIPAVMLGLIDFLDRPVRAIPAAWMHGVTAGLALALSILNAFVHSRDAYSSVVPDGLTLSAVAAVLILISALSGWRVAYNYGCGRYPEHAA
jgi:uncharacterized membrane protein